MKQKAILVAMIMMVAVCLGAVVPVQATYSKDVTTTWIVPGDETIGVTYPTGEIQITFPATGKNFTDLNATGQTPLLAALNVTNQGNQALKIEARWTEDFPAGVDRVNISVDDNTNATLKVYSSANETTNQTLKASLADDGYVNLWFWTTGTEVAQTAGADKTFRIYSSPA